VRIREWSLAILFGLGIGYWWISHPQNENDHTGKKFGEIRVAQTQIESADVISSPQKTPQPAVAQINPEKMEPQTQKDKSTIEWPTPPAPGMIEFEIKEGLAVTQGDIVLGKPVGGQSDLKKGVASANKTNLWPSHEIPYSIQNEIKQKSQVLEAIDYFQQNTVVRFVPYNGQKDSLVFVPAKELCASYLGKAGGAQPIYLAPQCGVHQIIHELMHALGFVHEHARPDRDQFLEVIWSHIPPEFHLQFWMMPDTLVHDYSGAVFNFDSESIMLYEKTAFARAPGLITLQPKGNYELNPSQASLSRIDRERIFYLYGQ
jgi:Astacin (Peptidase family M12A)